MTHSLASPAANATTTAPPPLPASDACSQDRFASQAALIRFEGVSKWFGNVIGLNNLTVEIGPGLTGLLGPNGAGKSTLLQLATGQLKPSQGRVEVLGVAPWGHPGLNHHLGLCPEQDAFYEWMTGRRFVTFRARLQGMSPKKAAEAAAQAIDLVSMGHAADRPIKGYSKGMRQRIKLAQALVHHPKVLFLDEPFTGTDPVARREIMDAILAMGRRGVSVVVSSHVLYEVEALTDQVVMLNRGRLVATGRLDRIRDLIDRHPHRIVIRADDPRAVAAELVKWDHVVGLNLKRDDGSILVETHQPDRFYDALPELATRPGLIIRGLHSDDDNLEAVFQYLIK
jgi:ABC-2 type transport system ATP-binding protein